MLQIKLKFVATIKKYTVADIKERAAIQSINKYPVDHPNHKSEHMCMYITMERIHELQPIASKLGYTFIIQ